MILSLSIKNSFLFQSTDGISSSCFAELETGLFPDFILLLEQISSGISIEILRPLAVVLACQASITMNWVIKQTNKQTFISHSSGGWKSKTWCWQIWRVRGCISWFTDGCLFCNVQKWWREENRRKLFLDPCEVSNPFHDHSTHNLI